MAEARSLGLAAYSATVAASALVQARVQASPALIVLSVVQPAAFGVIAIALRDRGVPVSVSSTAVAVGVMSLWATTVWQSGVILRQNQRQGTLAAILVRPLPLQLVLMGMSLGSTLRSAIPIAATVFGVSLLFGDMIHIADPLAFSAALAAVMASATVLGMLISCAFLLTRAAVRIAEALTYPVFILGNLLVPASLLPDWLEPVSAAISLRWGSDLLRAAVLGNPQAAGAWAGLIVTTLIYAVAAHVCLRLVLDRAKRRGTLEFV